MKTHELKVWPKYFKAIFDGDKNFEVRKYDRDFMTGDDLVLREWDNNTESYTGMFCTAKIKYVLHGGQFGIEPGYCVMALRKYPF